MSEKKKSTDPEKETFSTVFLDRLARIYEDAEKNGVSMSELCRAAKISRATPDNWRRVIPRTIEIIDQLESALEKQLRVIEREAKKLEKK